MPRLITILALALALGCGGGTAGPEDAGSDATPDAGDPGPAITTLTHTFPPVHVEIGEESLGTCQSWTLNNEEPIYVHAVKQSNPGAWHHSNWFFLPENAYGDANVDDGTWRCRDRNWNEVAAAAQGGVLFAQSTQAPEETQRFPRGAVLKVPAHSKVAGDIHLVNVLAQALDSPLTMTIESIQEEDVDVLLSPFSFSIGRGALFVTPGGSRHSMTCNLRDVFRSKFGDEAEADYNIYYVLPHYHQFGNYFRLDLLDGEGGETTIFETTAVAGDALGGTMDPIIPSQGAPFMRVTCGYNNSDSRTWEYGFADGEMCVFLAYHDGNIKVGATANSRLSEEPRMEDGVETWDANCAGVVGL